MKVDKEFLLKESKTFCMAPWVEVHVTTTGEIVPCCAADIGKPLGNTQQGDTLEESWKIVILMKILVERVNEIGIIKILLNILIELK